LDWQVNVLGGQVRSSEKTPSGFDKATPDKLAIFILLFSFFSSRGWYQNQSTYVHSDFSLKDQP